MNGGWIAATGAGRQCVPPAAASGFWPALCRGAPRRAP